MLSLDWEVILIVQSFLTFFWNPVSLMNDQIQSYWLKIVPVVQWHIAENVNANVEEQEKVSDWLTIGIT